MVVSGPYNHQRRTIVLQFEDMPGLEVVVRSLPVGTMLDMADVADAARAGSATREERAELFRAFARSLVSWNLHIDGEPVPADYDGVRSLDADLFMAMLRGWFDGMSRTPKASPQPSANGSSLPVVSLPMETLYPSLAG